MIGIDSLGIGIEKVEIVGVDIRVNQIITGGFVVITGTQLMGTFVT